jgi:hypothetical protein
LSLPESAGLLRLRIGALDYVGNDRVRYRYRIDGIDPDWIDNGNRSDITYTLLPAGHYLFRAQSTNHDGIWSPGELRIPIDVSPPPGAARWHWPRMACWRCWCCCCWRWAGAAAGVASAVISNASAIARSG